MVDTSEATFIVEKLAGRLVNVITAFQTTMHPFGGPVTSVTAFREETYEEWKSRLIAESFPRGKAWLQRSQQSCLQCGPTKQCNCFGRLEKQND